MDARNVRILSPYSDMDIPSDTLLIDESARVSLHTPWGGEVFAVGRKEAFAKIQQLRPEDAGGQITRMSEAMRDKLYCEVGDEVLLYMKD